MSTVTGLSLTCLLLCVAGCTPDGGLAGSEGEEGGSALMPCENPADDLGFGFLDRNSDGMLGPDDLEAGEAAVQAIWIDGSGTKTVLRQVTSDAKIWHGDGLGDLTRYGVWLTLEHPQGLNPLYTTAVFEGPVEGIDAPGSFARVSSNWDLAAIERGGSNEDVAGSIELTLVDGDLASGHVPDASGAIEIIDYLEQAPAGDVVCVQTVVFREITTELAH